MEAVTSPANLPKTPTNSRILMRPLPPDTLRVHAQLDRLESKITRPPSAIEAGPAALRPMGRDALTKLSVDLSGLAAGSREAVPHA